VTDDLDFVALDALLEKAPIGELPAWPPSALDGFLVPSGTSPLRVARPLVSGGAGENTNEEER
jgi:hypothetical protein